MANNTQLASMLVNKLSQALDLLLTVRTYAKDVELTDVELKALNSAISACGTVGNGIAQWGSE